MSRKPVGPGSGPSPGWLQGLAWLSLWPVCPWTPSSSTGFLDLSGFNFLNFLIFFNYFGRYLLRDFKDFLRGWPWGVSLAGS